MGGELFGGGVGRLAASQAWKSAPHIVYAPPSVVVVIELVHIDDVIGLIDIEELARTRRVDRQPDVLDGGLHARHVR